MGVAIRSLDYLQDRVRGLGQVPRLAELIRQRIAESTTGKAEAVLA